VNLTRLNAVIAERGALRFTPAGIPALDLLLEHASRVHEAGTEREVRLNLKALAIGTPAERLSVQASGTEWTFQGFLSSARQGRGVVFHIQDFQQK